MILREKRFKPLPNAYTRDKNWTVEEANQNSTVDAMRHTVSAPTHISDTATFERIRINARASIAHLRAKDNTIPSWLYQAAFDQKARMMAHESCREITEATPYPIPPMTYNVTNHNWQDVIEAINLQSSVSIGGTDTEYEEEFYNAVHSVSYPADKICNQIAQQIRHAAARISATDTFISEDAISALRIAKEMYDLIEELSDMPPPQIGDQPIDTGSTDNAWTNWDEVIDRVAAWQSAYADNEAVWADMEITTHLLTERVPGFMGKRRKRRLTDAGSALTRPDRIMTDGLCFDAKGNRRDVVGAVLIDNSGSMAFTAHDVESLVQAAPGVTIAHYSGSGDGGILEIVCENGRRATTEYLEATYGGNGVDGPALEWLAQQNGPRVWVSDGLVTGKYDSTGVALVHDCMNICNKADITRVPDILVLTKWVEQQRSR